ncbi:MAG: Eco57I restriction-modification methylase domain-containing protein [Alphaproteobacteria bacterium]
MTKRVDILEQLQCMVNTETPTPLKVVNSMLDLIPESVWLDDNAKILCPACKDGIFLREAVVRILRAKFKQLPDDKNAVYDFTMRQEGILHQILKERIFGIAVSYRGYRVTKRTLYTCNPAFADIDNIFFDESLGEYVKDKSGAQIEKQCFHFIKDTQAVADFFAKKGVEDMKFDVIIGNPPYQLNVGNEGGNKAKAKAMYHLFVEQALKLQPNYLTMIIPSRWMTRTTEGIPNEWIDAILTSHCFRTIHDFEAAEDCFPGVSIMGGVNYFLWDKKYDGNCEYIYHYAGGNTTAERCGLLDPNKLGFIIRDPKSHELIHKIEKIEGDYSSTEDNNFSGLVSPKDFFTNKQSLTSSWDKFSDKKDKKFNIKYYLNKQIHRKDYGWVTKDQVPKNHGTIPLHKVIIPTANGSMDIVLGRPFYGEPNSVCSQTYLVIGYNPEKHNFSKTQCENIISYIKTRFFRYLVSIKKKTQNGPRGVYQFVPMQNFDEPWTDEKLYKKYNLTKDEISFIESTIKPMDTDIPTDVDTNDE